jgi:hypothetical protein
VDARGQSPLICSLSLRSTHTSTTSISTGASPAPRVSRLCCRPSSQPTSAPHHPQGINELLLQQHSGPASPGDNADGDLNRTPNAAIRGYQILDYRPAVVARPRAGCPGRHRITHPVMLSIIDPTRATALWDRSGDWV